MGESVGERIHGGESPWLGDCLAIIGQALSGVLLIDKFRFLSGRFSLSLVAWPLILSSNYSRASSKLCGYCGFAWVCSDSLCVLRISWPYLVARERKAILFFSSFRLFVHPVMTSPLPLADIVSPLLARPVPI